jgi:hypothetical protein
MTESVTLVEPTTPLRDWLRTQTLTSGARIYCDGPPKGVTLPAVVLTRIGGPVQMVMDLGLYQFDCYGETMPDAKSAGYELATLLSSTFEQQLSASPDGCRMAGGSIASMNPIQDPDNPAVYRFVVTAQITTIHIP